MIKNFTFFNKHGEGKLLLSIYGCKSEKKAICKPFSDENATQTSLMLK